MRATLPVRPGNVLLVALFAASLALLALSACDKKGEGEGTAGKEPAPAVEKPAAERSGEPSASAGTEAETKDEPASTAPGDETKAGETPSDPARPAGEGEGVAGKAKTAVNKETLAKAYEEIYCAQKQGKTDQILDIYKKYGFESPKEWTEAWAATSEDVEWQAALTRRVQAAKCE